MEYPHGIHLLIDGTILDFDVIGIAVNPYNREGVLSKFCERNATTKKYRYIYRRMSEKVMRAYYLVKRS